MSRDDRVIERIYIKGAFVLQSPMMVGSGQELSTDKDVLKDKEGKPFIPGQTIAGVLRSFLAQRCFPGSEPPALKILFGPQEADSSMSLISFFDACCEGRATIGRRDGLARDWTTRTASKGAKYDYEVVELPAAFVMRFAVVIREKHRPIVADLKHELYLMLAALAGGDIRFGAKTRRGFGQGRLENTQIMDLVFDPCPVSQETLDAWTGFSWDDFRANVTGITAFQKPSGRTVVQPHTKISAFFRLDGGLLIAGTGAGQVEVDAPDAQQLRSSAGFIIPGTGWGGAVKNQVMGICRMLSLDRRIDDDKNVFEVVRSLFGYVDETTKQACSSRIWFDETVFASGESYRQNRNRIDRYTGGTVKGGLFDEQPVLGNGVNVELAIRIENAEEYEIALVLLALRDIGSGIQPIGGTVNVGRGILKGTRIEVNGDVMGTGDARYRSYMQALYRLCPAPNAPSTSVASTGGEDAAHLV